MRAHWKLGRFRAVIAAVVLAIGGLAAVTVSAQPAAASGPCTPSFSNAIASWSQVSLDHPATGVTLCRGEGNLGAAAAWLQIVNMSQGASVRLIADPCSLTESCSGKFHVRQADQWAAWIHTNPNINPSRDLGAPPAHIHPDSSRLFSVSNAAFFTDDTGPPSTLSLPFFQTTRTDPGSGYNTIDFGSAQNNSNDPAWDDPKKAITIGDYTNVPQQVNMFLYPSTCSDSTNCNHYQSTDVYGAPFAAPFGGQTGSCSVFPSTTCEWDANVGFPPDFDIVTGAYHGTTTKRRTYVGIAGGINGNDHVYILDTVNEYTADQAQAILKSFGTTQEVQLDGGGSTQLYADGKFLEQASCQVVCFGRAVPLVLAVYGA
jgi:Phosphodiester glycosidase